MKIEFDPNKSIKNAAQRGLPFELAAEFDFTNAVVGEDIRLPYGERRFVAAGYIQNRLHILCFTSLENGIRVISLRKANKRECMRYEKESNQ